MFGHKNLSMYYLKPIGKTCISNRRKEIVKWLDLKDWENFREQSLRVLMATKLGNNASVNISDSMAALRHNSVAAYKHYNKTSEISETCKYKVLDLIKK